MRRVDREALGRALAEYRLDPLSDDQIRRMLEHGTPWQRCAELAAFGCQCRNLNLRPHQPAPSDMTDERPVPAGTIDLDPGDGHVAAWELRQRMLAAGLSQYEPDPLGALDRATLPAA
jgi:hypothetical protein